MLILAASAGSESTFLTTLLGWGWTILSVGGGLGFVIFVHELGHFLVAKACGVKCEKFYVGFDVPMPKILGWQIPSKLVHFQWGETEYGVGILPLGGYVKMLGQDDDPRNAEKEAARTKVIQEGTAAEGLTPGQTVEKVQLDPRSLTAKSVPARAAIFAAGVTMNLIFGVLLGAVAYWYGVPEIPAMIGGTAPGGPAWTENVPVGGKVLQFGRDGKPYEHLRFEDLMREVIFNGGKHELSMLVRTPDGRETWFDVQPSTRLKKITKRASLGVAPLRGLEVASRSPATAHLDAKTDVLFANRDKIVAVNGQKLAAGFELAEILARNPSGPLDLTVQRKTESTDAAGKKVVTVKEVQIVLQPRAMRELGLVMKIGPIVAVRKGSPAAEAGFQVGDVIEQVDGGSVGDPLSLGQRLIPASEPAKPIEFTISRPATSGKPAQKTLTVTPELPRQYTGDMASGGPGAIESIGVAFEVTPVVASVVEGSPAAKAGLAAGDTLTQAQFIAANEEARLREQQVLGDKNAFEPIVLDNLTKNWNAMFFRLQDSLPDTRLKLTWTRGDKTMSGELASVDSTTFFDESRGLALFPEREKHIAKNWSEALFLGYRETVERLKEVLRVLTGLLTGGISPTNLSGPLGIIGAASSFASEGIPMLLIFLTMLSANLAILNMLPIPALDGGHLLFLAAEAVRGKPVDEKLQMKLTIAGVLCLLSLMVFATAMDFSRFFS